MAPSYGVKSTVLGSSKKVGIVADSCAEITLDVDVDSFFLVAEVNLEALPVFWSIPVVIGSRRLVMKLFFIVVFASIYLGFLSLRRKGIY